METSRPNQQKLFIYRRLAPADQPSISRLQLRLEGLPGYRSSQPPQLLLVPGGITERLARRGFGNLVYPLPATARQTLTMQTLGIDKVDANSRHKSVLRIALSDPGDIFRHEQEVFQRRIAGRLDRLPHIGDVRLTLGYIATAQVNPRLLGELNRMRPDSLVFDAIATDPSVPPGNHQV